MPAKESVKIIEFNEIGKVSFIRKDSSRSLRITIRPFSGVRVTVPRFVSFESAGRFVENKIEWIKGHQAKMDRYVNRVTVFDEQTLFSTRDYALEIGKHPKSTIQVILRNGIIRVNYPHYADVKDPRVQKVIRRAILQAWRIEANKYLPLLLERLAKQHGLGYGRITFRNNKTRWGSCSRRNNISLNIHLMRLPEYLCEYILLHELCHTVHKHHQQSFWLYLDRITGGRAKILDRELNRYSPEIW
jgi:predicted metal-dependent hydrolase